MDAALCACVIVLYNFGRWLCLSIYVEYIWTSACYRNRYVDADIERGMCHLAHWFVIFLGKRCAQLWSGGNVGMPPHQREFAHNTKKGDTTTGEGRRTTHLRPVVC